jgi:hypothetical protein
MYISPMLGSTLTIGFFNRLTCCNLSCFEWIRNNEYESEYCHIKLCHI